jgi:hypothetical protein
MKKIRLSFGLYKKTKFGAKNKVAGWQHRFF